MSFLLLLPGLNQHGIITKYTSMAKREINKLMKHKEKKNEWVGPKCRSREQIREQPHHQMTRGRKLEKRRQSVSWVCCLFRVFFFSVPMNLTFYHICILLSSRVSFTCSVHREPHIHPLFSNIFIHLQHWSPSLHIWASAVFYFYFIFCQWWFESHHRVTTE